MGLLRRRPFALLFVGTALNAIGSWATLIALWGYAAYRFHASPGQVGLVGLAWALPGAVLSPAAGIPIDRIGPKRVLMASDALGAATSLAMATSKTFGALVALALVHGAVQAFAQPAVSTLPPRLVSDGDLLAANSLLGAAEQSALVFGPLVGAAAIGLWSLRGAFLVDAVTFVIGAATVAPLRLSPAPRRIAQSARAELVSGLRLARDLPLVRFTLALSAAVYFSWGAFFVIEPLYVRDVLHRSPALLGLFQTVFGIGLVGTALLLPRLGDKAASPSGLATSVVLSGVAAATYVGTGWVAVAYAGVFLWGIDVAFFTAPMQTLLQRGTPEAAHGRVLALGTTLNGIGNLVAIPLTGIVVAALGVHATGIAVGAVVVIAGGIALVRRRPESAPASAQLVSARAR